MKTKCINTKDSIVTAFNLHQHLAALLSLLVVCLLAVPASVQAIEDPPGCSLGGGGLGNTSSGGINFDILDAKAHVGDIVPVFPSLGMVVNACRAINATGSVWIAGAPFSTTGGLNAMVRQTNFLINVTLDPGALVSCPGPDVKCQPGPYNILITPELVGAGVSSPNGSINGAVKSVRAVQNGEGTVQTGDTPEQLADFHTATINIVTPCIQVVKECAYPAGTNCFAAGSPINFTGYVTNCGDIRLTNVTILDSRTTALFTPQPPPLPPLPLVQPLTLDPGEAVQFLGSFTPTLAETCAGSAANTITVSGTDITTIGGPNASVTNQTTVACNICIHPCLTVTKECTTVAQGQLQTVSGVVANCGDIAITNIVITDNVFGSITTIASLDPGASAPYSRDFPTTTCGNTVNIVTASGSTACGAPIQASATNTCVVTCPPCIDVTKLVACYLTNDNCGPFGKVATGMKGDNQLAAFCYSITISNCGSVNLTNVIVNDDKLGALSGFPVSLAVGQSTNLLFKMAWATDTTNTVNVSGQSSVTGEIDTDTDNAVAIVLVPTVTCEQSVTPAELPNDGLNHDVTFTTVLCAGPVGLSNVVFSSMYCSGTVTTIPANSCVTNVCTVSLNCSNSINGAFTNTMIVTAHIDTSSGLCATDTNGAPITISNTNQATRACEVVVICVGCELSVVKTACILPPPCPEVSQECTGGAVAFTIQYTGADINGPTVVTVTGSSGAVATYNLPSLINGDTLTSPSENGFTIDSQAHGGSKLGTTVRVDVNNTYEVFHTSCSCRNNPETNLKVCNPMCLDASSPNNNTGEKGAPSPSWRLIAEVDPGLGLRTCTTNGPVNNAPCPQECTGGAVAFTLKYTGPDIPGPTVVKLTASSGAEVTYNLASLINGDILTSAGENGFTIDSQAHGGSKLGTTVRVDLNDSYEVFHTSCSCRNNPETNLKVCNPMCLDASSPNNNTGEKGAPSPSWTLVAEVDPGNGLSVCSEGTTNGVNGECVTVIPADASGKKKKCNGDVLALQLTYLGGGCANTQHSQHDHDVKCETFNNAPLASPVRLVVTDKPGADQLKKGKDGGKVYLDTGSPANFQLNDIVTVHAGDHFRNDIVVSIFNANNELIQQVKFKTDDCKKLNLGDIYGGVRIAGITSKGGGNESLGVNVLYTYTIKNEGPSTLTDVTVVDDVLGVVPGSPITSIPGFGTVVLQQTVMVSDSVTNIVIVTASGASCSATGQAAIVRAPAPVNTECDGGIVAFLLQYTGPDKPPGTTLRFTGGSGASVTYTFPTGLTTGTVLSLPSEADPSNAWTIDASKHGASKLGTQTTVRFDGLVTEVFHTSCSCQTNNFIPGQPACLDSSSPDNNTGSKGAPSPLFLVVNFKD